MSVVRWSMYRWRLMADGQPDSLQLFRAVGVVAGVRLLSDQVHEIKDGLFQPQGLGMICRFVGGSA